MAHIINGQTRAECLSVAYDPTANTRFRAPGSTFANGSPVRYEGASTSRTLDMANRIPKLTVDSVEVDDADAVHRHGEPIGFGCRKSPNFTLHRTYRLNVMSNVMLSTLTPRLRAP